MTTVRPLLCRSEAPVLRSRFAVTVPPGREIAFFFASQGHPPLNESKRFRSENRLTFELESRGTRLRFCPLGHNRLERPPLSPQIFDVLRLSLRVIDGVTTERNRPACSPAPPGFPSLVFLLARRASLFPPADQGGCPLCAQTAVFFPPLR